MAPQKCQVCTHPKTQEIDERIVKGEPHTQIALDYDGLNYQNIWRHAQNHLPEKLTRAVRKREEQHAENILDGIKDLLDRTKSILDDAEDAGQKTTALQAIREARSTYELLSKIAVKLEEYRRADEEKEDQQVSSKISEGLKALSDDELKALIQLQAKVYANNPDYELDSEVRMFLDGVRQIWPETKSGAEAKSGQSRHERSEGTSKSMTRTKSARNRPSQAKNTKRQKDEVPEMIDDLDLDLEDLSLDDDNTIPSEETDPDWLKHERRRNR